MSETEVEVGETHTPAGGAQSRQETASWVWALHTPEQVPWALESLASNHETNFALCWLQIPVQVPAEGLWEPTQKLMMLGYSGVSRKEQVLNLEGSSD